MLGVPYQVFSTEDGTVNKTDQTFHLEFTWSWESEQSATCNDGEMSSQCNGERYGRQGFPEGCFQAGDEQIPVTSQQKICSKCSYKRMANTEPEVVENSGEEVKKDAQDTVKFYIKD